MIEMSGETESLKDEVTEEEREVEIKCKKERNERNKKGENKPRVKEGREKMTYCVNM